MKRVVLAGVLAVVLPAAACSNSQAPAQTASEVPIPEGVPRCDEVFTDGAPVDPATFGNACRTADDELSVPRPGVINCQDGRKILWNDLAWGYEGGGMQLWDPNEPVKVPSDQALNCLGASTTSTTAPDADDEG